MVISGTPWLNSQVLWLEKSDVQSHDNCLKQAPFRFGLTQSVFYKWLVIWFFFSSEVYTLVKRKNPTPLQVLSPWTLQEFEEKTCWTFVRKCYKIVLWERITSWESLRMSISKFPGRVRSIKLNFSVTVLTLGLKAKIFKNLRLLLSFGGNCARAPRLTAVWAARSA